MERSFRPRPRNVEPFLFPVCLVQVPRPSEHWWVAWYLPDLDSAIPVQQALYEHRVTLDPSREPQLTTEWSRRKQDLAIAIYERLGSMEMDMDDASGPVWLLMGPHATMLSCRHVQQYLSVGDAAFLTQMAELTQAARGNPDLQKTLEDFRDYHQWSKRQVNLTKVLVPPKATTRTTSILLDHGDSATVVTNASVSLEESPAGEVAEPTTGKRARPTGHSRSSKRRKTAPKKSSPKSATRSIPTVNNQTPPSNQKLDPLTPRDARKRKTPEGENSATKFNSHALAEANGYRKRSPRLTKTYGRRQVFPPIEQKVVAVREPLKTNPETTETLGIESSVKEQQSTIGQCSVIENEASQQQQQKMPEQKIPQQQHESASADHDKEVPANLDKPGTAINLEHPQRQEAQQEIHLEPIPPVNLPGVTVREKLNSCLNALRKENETIVACNKINAAQQAILDFFHSVVHSKGVTGPNETLPILHVCGAPGSGKSMTVEICQRMVTEACTRGCDEWEEKVPPRFCFVNCTHLQNHSKQEALATTLEYAETTEHNLKRPKNIDDCKRPTTIFILDEIDILVSKHSKGFARSEQYIQTLLEWASSSQYMVGVLGISNSVENEKVARLVDLGFPRTNKVVFRTYDEADLTRIAITKIGTSVVDEKAIEFLSKKVAGASGDARKFLEILSRSIASAKEELSEATINAIHDKPVIKVPHFTKTVKSSTIKYKEVVESAPSHEKHILFVCIHLARTIGARPLSLSRLLWICQQVFDALELTSVSELKSILARLLDSGLLKWTQRDDKIRFDSQLEEVESAVEEVLLIQKFYRTTFEALEKLNVAQWID